MIRVYNQGNGGWKKSEIFHKEIVRWIFLTVTDLLKRMYMYFQMHIHVFYQNTKAEPDALALRWFIEIG